MPATSPDALTWVPVYTRTDEAQRSGTGETNHTRTVGYLPHPTEDTSYHTELVRTLTGWVEQEPTWTWRATYTRPTHRLDAATTHGTRPAWICETVDVGTYDTEPAARTAVARALDG